MKQKSSKSTLPAYTKNQLKILDFLYQFRFLHTYQFQKLVHHKDPHRVKEWLKDLVQKGYIESNYQKNVFPHKPAVYSLTKLGRKLLKGNEQYSLNVLDLVYRKISLTEHFIEHHLTIADLYLFFEKTKEQSSTIKFFTKYKLIAYEYLKPLELDAYIAVKKGNKTKRYFLHVFGPFTPPFVYRKKVKDYFHYVDDNIWQESTKNSPFPTVLFVCHSNSVKKHVSYFTKGLFEKTYEKPFSLYVTTKDILLGEKEYFWEEV